MNPVRVKILLFAALAITSLGARGADPTDEHQRSWDARPAGNAALLRKLDDLQPMKLYRLDGGFKKVPAANQGSFHDETVVASAVPVDDSLRKDFMASLRRVLESSNAGESACFNPHHGVTLGDGQERYDIVLCFDCLKFAVYDANGQRVYVSGFSADDQLTRWNEIFAAAGI